MARAHRACSESATLLAQLNSREVVTVELGRGLNFARLRFGLASATTGPVALQPEFRGDSVS
jgi:hypothetical protein